MKEKLPADIWVLVSAAFIVALGYGIIAPVLPQFADSFGLGITAATVVVSSFAFFRLVCAPAGGAMVNRMGERWVYVTGLLVVAASTFAVALAQTYWQLLLFRGLGGLGSTMFTVSAMAIIIRIAPTHMRARATGAYAQAFLVGNILGPVVGGLMAGWGIRVPFVVYAVGLVIAALVVRLRLGKRTEVALPATDGSAPEAPSTPAENVGSAPATSSRFAARRARKRAERAVREADRLPRMRFREAWQDSAYRASLVSSLANGWTSNGIRVALYPLFVVHVLQADARIAGIALTVFAVGNVIAARAVGRWADSVGRRPFVLGGLAVLAASTFGLAFVGHTVPFLLLSALSGLGAGLLNPAQQAVVGDVIGKERAGGTVLSRFQMSMDAGAIFGPIVAGALAEQLGYGTAFAVSGAIAALGFLVWLTGRETLPSRETPLSREGASRGPDPVDGDGPGRDE
ncbi:MFS transporter [Brevibacterium litoralis]|uniref:MFS transporter n=1 Tax=Brevibacterium litoralis TaxID=3138935 RepID=UPI0032EB96AC